MTVSYSQAKKVYQGDGETTKWEIGFPFLQVQDLQVIRVEADGTENVLNGDFTVDTQLNEVCYPMSGSQTPPLTQGEKLIIRRRTPLTQQTEFHRQQAFDPFLLEAGYDKAVMMVQELAEELSRAVRFPVAAAGVQTDARGYLDALRQTQQAAVQANSSALQALAEAQQTLTRLQTLAAQAASSAQLAQGKASEASTSAQEASDDASAAAASAQTAAQHAQSISVHLQNTDNPHAVSKAQVGLGNVDNTSDADKPVSTATQAALDLKADSAEVEEEVADINAALARKEDDDEFHPEDYNWPDIRPAARPNAIVLMAGVKADYSAYDNLGFVATCEGGYNVFIDGVQYGETYASDAQCSITWSQYSATAGFPVTYPEAFTAHIVQIVPAVAGNNITLFKCARVSSSGTEPQGVLWAHINFEHAVNVAFCISGAVKMPLMAAVTASGNTLKINYSINFSFASCNALAYVPVLDGENRTIYGGQTFNGSIGLKKVHFKNMKLSNIAYTFYGASALEKVIFESVDTSACKLMSGAVARVKNLPYVDFTSAEDCNGLFSGGTGEMNPFVLDVSYAKNVTRFGVEGISALTELTVCPAAPFTGASPQINVGNTGLDQAALVALFKSLPYNVGYTVVGSPTIQDGVASGFTSNDYLKIDSGLSFNSLEAVINAKEIPSSAENQGGILRLSGDINLNVLLQNDGSVRIYYKNSSGNSVYLPAFSYVSNGFFKITISASGVNTYFSIDGASFSPVATSTAEPAGLSFTNAIWGYSTSVLQAFTGAVDLNNSYINVNNVPWFRGTAAMDKTINITGATGAASLTAEQLAIATDKGWTVTR